MAALLHSISQLPLQFHVGTSYISHKKTYGKEMPLPVLNFKTLRVAFSMLSFSYLLAGTQGVEELCTDHVGMENVQEMTDLPPTQFKLVIFYLKAKQAFIFFKPLNLGPFYYSSIISPLIKTEAD